MAKHWLCIVPVWIEAETTVSRWQEESEYKWKKQMKQKQSILTEVKTKYMLLHTSGESIEISWYGHGIDSQDKGAWKATTYALKYALLYIFLIPTGDIDDSDTTHSDDQKSPPAKYNKDSLPAFGQANFDARKNSTKDWKPTSVADMKKFFTVTPERATKINEYLGS